MSKYLSLFWIVPAAALLSLPFVIVVTAVTHACKFQLAHAVASDIYEIMLLVTPAVGIVTLLSILVLRVAGLTDFKRSIVTRAIVFACLDIAAPFVFIILFIVLSGFTR
jgi:hypothetical protein